MASVELTYPYLEAFPDVVLKYRLEMVSSGEGVRWLRSGKEVNCALIVVVAGRLKPLQQWVL